MLYTEALVQTSNVKISALQQAHQVQGGTTYYALTQPITVQNQGVVNQINSVQNISRQYVQQQPPQQVSQTFSSEFHHPMAHTAMNIRLHTVT